MDGSGTEPLISVRECGRQLDLAHTTIGRQIKAGIIPNHGTESRPLVRLSEVKAARANGLDQSKMRGPNAPLSRPLDDGADEETAAGAADVRAPKLDFNRARTASEGYSAALKQLELEERRGNVLDKAEVIDAVFAIAQALRESIERRQPILASRVAGLADVNAIVQILADEDRKLLQGVADEFTRRFVEPAAA